MASSTQKKKRTTRKKISKQGKSRKREVRINGTTPAFPIHPDKPGRKVVDVTALKIGDQTPIEG
ncbi:hypothetical protein JXA80_02660 [bacterium]|nr:hypothetical protein [candidate division CSSED10-310 bacterium]